MTNKEQLLITKYDLLFESRLSKTEITLEKLEKNLDYTLKGINENIREIKIDLRWILGFMISGFVGLFGLMAHALHWF